MKIITLTDLDLAGPLAEALLAQLAHLPNGRASAALAIALGCLASTTPEALETAHVVVDEAAKINREIDNAQRN